MKSFKHFFLEAVKSKSNIPPPPESFSVPPPRARYQLGDIILFQSPQDEEYIKERMPKYLHPYVNAVGKIIGHRISGISTHYAVEFEDKMIGKIPSGFIVGAFRSFDSAKKYQGRSKLTSSDIASEDHKRHAEAATEIGTDENIETAFKKLFVKEGEFIWLDEPLSFVEGKIKVLILAYKPLPTNVFYWYEKPSSIPDEIESSQIFYKKVDYVSNKLMKTSTFTLRGGSSSYGMTAPTHDPHATKFNNGTITQLGIEYYTTAINTTKALETIYKQTRNLKRLEEVRDGIAYFDLSNNVREQGNIKIVPVNNDNFYKITHIPNNITEDINAFKNYIFEGGVKTTCIVNKQVVFPKEVKGDKCFVILDSTVENLNGFPKLSRDCKVEISGPVKSYAGLPQEFNCSNVHVKNNSSLTNFPKIINGDCELSNIDSFKGGEDTVINGMLIIHQGPTSYKNIPEAEDYSGFANHDAEVKKIKEVIRQRRYVNKQLSSDWNVDLDDFS